MKIKITQSAPTTTARFFSKPLDFDQRVEKEKLLAAEQILERMEGKKMNRTQLAEAMGVSCARVTSMLNGTNNFTIETLMRAAESVGGKLSIAVAPKGHQIRHVHYREDDVHTVFKPQRLAQPEVNSPFTSTELAKDDPCHAA